MLVKICGVTSRQAATQCAQAGADFLGLNFHPPSVRFISDALAAEIVNALPGSCLPVGVFVDRPVEHVRATAKTVGLHWVQLHGNEPISDILELQASGLAVIRAYRIGTVEDLQQMAADLCQMSYLGANPQAVLVDAKGQPGQPGGTGRTIPAELIAQLPRFPTGSDDDPASPEATLPPSRLILAGGLNPTNVAAQIQNAGRSNLWMVDTASGVEQAPGLKDPVKVEAFLKAARGA